MPFAFSDLSYVASDLLRELLQAATDPDAGVPLYRLHAEDAPLRSGDEIVPARQIAPGDFASVHREIALAGSARLPHFVDPELASIEATDPTRAVAWFRVRESRSSHGHFIALGLKGVDDCPKITWCTLSTRIQSWSFVQGLQQSLSDYPWMKTCEPARARLLLDASYFRLFHRPALAFQTLADARFSCHSSTACCRQDYEIALPISAQLVIDAIPWDQLAPAVGTRLRLRPDGRLQLKELDEPCRFLGPRGQCLIHQTLGRQPFGPCAVFPFAFAHTPEGIAVGLSPICASVRLGLGIPPAQREEDLRERLTQAEPRRTASYRLAPTVEIAWDRFKQVETALCELVALESIPLRQRLYLGTRLLAALRDGEPIDLERWSSEPLPLITPELRTALQDMLRRILRWDRRALKDAKAELPPDLHLQEAQETAVVARILRNVLFCKVYSYPFDLTTAFNLAIVLYLVTLALQAATAGPLPDILWQEIGALGVHGVLRSLLNEQVPAGFIEFFGRPELGQWLLAV